MSDSKLPPVSPTALGAQFQPTAWSDLVALADPQDPVKQREALERICRSYWKPIYAFIRRSGSASAEAQDLTQDFFHHLLRKERFKLADRRRGRFRSFVLKALQNFLASDWDRRHARKRDTRVVVSLDETFANGGFVVEPRTEDTPAHAFDRGWVEELFKAVRGRLEAELRASGRTVPVELIPLAMLDDPECRCAEVAARVGMSEAAVKKAAQRLRARWAQLLREEVAATVQSPADVEEEIQDILALIGKATPVAASVKES